MKIPVHSESKILLIFFKLNVAFKCWIILQFNIWNSHQLLFKNKNIKNVCLRDICHFWLIVLRSPGVWSFKLDEIRCLSLIVKISLIYYFNKEKENIWSNHHLIHVSWNLVDSKERLNWKELRNLLSKDCFVIWFEPENVTHKHTNIFRGVICTAWP